jgi:hypothetical protein
VEMASSDAIRERRRQMSACRRKYAALGMGKSPSWSGNAAPPGRFRTKGGGQPFYFVQCRQSGSDMARTVIWYRSTVT